jgi:serine/threonine protein kinase
MQKTEIKKKGLLDHIRNEKHIMRTFKHPFITDLYCIFRDESYYYIVMEWAQGGDLYTIIKPGT